MNRMLISLIAATALTTAAQAEATDKTEQWLEDLEVYEERLEAGHIDLYHSMSQAEFTRRLDDLRLALPDLSDPEIEAELMMITHAIGDGHTAMPLWASNQARFPIEVRWIQGQAIVTGIALEHSDALGAAIVGWGGHSMAEVYQRLMPIAPFIENSGSEAVRVAQYLSYASLGHAIGLSDSARSVSLDLLVNGQSMKVDLVAVSSESYQTAVSERLDFRRDLSSNPTLLEAPGLRFVLLDDGKTGYIQFDSYPTIEAMSEFAGAVYTEMDVAGAENIVIDFRENFGGNFFVGLLLAANLVALDSIDWQEGVYVLTSGKTFSAAMSNAAQFADILNARLVGEPTGANPCGYQDTGSFNLPNSGHLIIYSKRYFCFADAVENALQPDVKIPITRENFVTGEDPALYWILSDIAGRNASQN